MLIYPAIDLMSGRCVRLEQGRFETATVYGPDPFVLLARFAQSGVTWAHIVDLDGARASAPRQYELIGRLAASQPVRIQAGGGVRGREDVRVLLESGVARAVIGSAAAAHSEGVRQWIAEFGAERICLALDVRRDGVRWKIAVHGWQDASDLTLDEVLALYPPGTARHVLITDISRDGMMAGPNAALIRYICALRPDLEVQASGGIAALNDLTQLKISGAAGAIVGRALYEGAFPLEEALHAG
jgi:phosphoribosylformimino-5-aminoimidazole carboxamide ribotide isomerase